MFDIRMANYQTVFFAFINDGQHTVVRRDKILMLGAGQQRPALGADARIYNHHMDCFRRKVRICGPNRQRGVKQIKWRDVVRDVYDGYVRIDLQDYALQRSDQMVVGPVVSCKGNDRVGQWTLSPGIICAWRADGGVLTLRIL